MTIPQKALKESQLVKEDNPLVQGASHQIERVSFFNEQGQSKKAFFKRISDEHNYRELLALISVATSIFKRSFQGDHSAEERLVYDDNERLIGTLSVAIDGFKPFNFNTETTPSDLDDREQVIPSTKTLIDKNIMEILLGRYFLDDDDAHPHNLGFSGDHSVDIDFDMFWYWFTVEMKGARPGLGVTRERRVNLTVADWERFPMIKEANIYHWPTYTHPGQESMPNVVPAQESIMTLVLPKAYSAPDQFQALARNREAQAQKMKATLKILLTYQPEVMRARLIDSLGMIPFNYASLGARLRKKYEEHYPSLCNKKTSEGSFVDFMMSLYQKHYDNLYRIVVFYMGCSDNGYGLSTPATFEALYRKPSFYQEIKAWIEEQNTRFYGHESLQFNYDSLQQRYHQVWRDSFAPLLNAVLNDAFALTTDYLQYVASQKSSQTVAHHLNFSEGKITADEEFTESAQFFSTLSHFNLEKIKPNINVEENSPLHQAVPMLIAYTNEFDTVVKNYYRKSCSILTNEDNNLFIREISRLIDNYKVNISEKLGHLTSWAARFDTLIARMSILAQQINFTAHLNTTDAQMEDKFLVRQQDELNISDPAVIEQINDALFSWAKKYSPAQNNAKELTQILNSIIDKYYNGARVASVKKYLDFSEQYDGDHRLAYILSSGTSDTGTLNTAIVRRLLPEALQTRPIPGLSGADGKNKLEQYLLTFVKKAVFFAKTEPRLIHLFNDFSIKLFFHTFYSLVDSLDTSRFNFLVSKALNDRYNKTRFFSGNQDRIRKLFSNSSMVGQAKTIASIFIQGDESSTLNGILFHALIAEFQKNIQNNSVGNEHTKGTVLIAQYDPAEKSHQDIYLKEKLKFYAVEQTQKQKGRSSSLTAAATI